MKVELSMPLVELADLIGRGTSVTVASNMRDLLVLRHNGKDTDDITFVEWEDMVGEATSTQPGFRSLEQRMPAWTTARAIVESLVPDRLTFAANYPTKNAVSIDWRWAQKIVDMAPPEDKAATVEMVDEMILAVGGRIPPVAFTGIAQEIAPATLDNMNSVLVNLDREAAALDKPRLMEVVLHYLGVRASPAVMSGL